MYTGAVPGGIGQATLPGVIETVPLSLPVPGSPLSLKRQQTVAGCSR